MKKTMNRAQMNGDFYDYCIEIMKKRGVDLNELAKITFDLQKPYYPEISMEECLDSIESVIKKRESQFAIMTGIELDRLAEENLLQGPISDIIKSDFGLYGIDEILALSISNIYGSIGLTNFGFLDKAKPGIIGEIDKKIKNSGMCNTFLDDLLCAICAGACSRIAHTVNV